MAERINAHGRTGWIFLMETRTIKHAKLILSSMLVGEKPPFDNNVVAYFGSSIHLLL